MPDIRNNSTSQETTANDIQKLLDELFKSDDESNPATNDNHPVIETAKNNNDQILDKIINDNDPELEEILFGNNTTITTTTNSNNIVIQETAMRPEDIDLLSQNENYRYLPNAKKVGHAVVMKNSKGEEVALQYEIPTGNNDDTPHFRPLINFNSIAVPRMNEFRLHATTPDGTKMFGKRFIDLEFTEDGVIDTRKIVCFSPHQDAKYPDPFWGISQQPPFFRTDLKIDEKKDLMEEWKKYNKSKGGNELEIEHTSVATRDLNKKRTPDQNTVMKESAVKAYEGFFETYKGELSPEMQEIFDRAIKAPLKDMFKSNYRPEWLHAEGFSLTPVAKDPQRTNNLGAGPKWANTEMMILERIAKWFALHRPHALIKIKPFFEMILDSHLIKKINFEVSLEENERFIKFYQLIHPLVKHHLFRKATDLTQGAAIAYAMLQGIKPITEDKITGGNIMPILKKSIPAATTTTTTTTSTPGTKRAKDNAAEKNDAPNIKSSNPVSILKKQNNTTAPGQPTSKFEFNADDYNQSVIRVLTTYHEFQYNEPWAPPHNETCSGSASVIAKKDNKAYLLTNAHVIENQAMLRVEHPHEPAKTYETTIVAKSYQCDLALIEVRDPEFVAIVKPIKFGDMINIRQKIYCVGYPMGGTLRSTTEGITSRIEVDYYCESGEDMLQVQTDTAINPGNSGGPIFDIRGKQVGVAFQGTDRPGGGYFIPMPIINHFLKEALNGNPTPSFPVLPMKIQHLKNPGLRKFFGLQLTQTGVRITSIDNLSDAFSKLKTNDVLLEIDGYRVSTDGKINIPGIGEGLKFISAAHLKYKGDTVKLKVLRKNEQSNQFEEHLIDVKLDSTPRSTKKMTIQEHDKMATYYIASGISFMPLTRNYLNEGGDKLESVYTLEQNCKLINIPKERPGDQIIIINDILDCKETYGYGKCREKIVKEINGKEIRNMLDVINAIESNNNAEHFIETNSKNIIAIKNMSKLEHDKLLKKYHIASDRSEDLQLVNTLSDATNNNDNASVTTVVQITKKRPLAKPVIEEKEEEEEENDDDFIVSDDGDNEERNSMEEAEENNEVKDNNNDDEADDDLLKKFSKGNSFINFLGKIQDCAPDVEPEEYAEIPQDVDNKVSVPDTHRLFKKRPRSENPDDEYTLQPGKKQKK